MSLLQIQRGIQNNPNSSNPFTARGGAGGELVVSQNRAPFFQTTQDGNGFNVSSQALVTTTVGLATTYTGMVLANPITSPVNLVLNKASFMQSVIQSTQPQAFAIATGFNAATNVTLTTPATPQTRKVGSGLVSQARAAISATLPTAPLYDTFVQNTPSATTNGAGGMIDLDGSIILLPGAYALWVNPGQASVAGMWFSFAWEEVPTTN